jgi:hybrid cluster-associated redox disulfide protein
MTITKETSIDEIMENYPEAAEVLIMHGMNCIGCQAAQFENLAQAAKAHGLDVNKLVDEMNALLDELEED